MLLLLILASIIQLVVSNSNTIIQLGVSPSIRYTTNCGEYNYFKVQVPDQDACHDLIISTDIVSGETNLYVSKTEQFPTKNMQTWAEFSQDVNSLTISRWDLQSSPGWYYIAVYADCSVTNKPAVYSIRADIDDTNDGTDILLNPLLATDFSLKTANSYKYFRFCLRDATQDVTIALDNCYTPDYGTTYTYVTATYPGCSSTTYTFPELIVSRNIIEPVVGDLTFKMATVSRRNVTVAASNVAGNDPNGYHSGVYYVAVWGWCTPDTYCTDLSNCGPCTYYSATPNMDVTVTTSSGKNSFFISPFLIFV